MEKGEGNVGGVGSAHHAVGSHAGITKTPTGIGGLDEITGGGLPAGRPTLVCGSAGSGKTMLAMEFLIRGAQEHAEPGVFVSFEERVEDLVANVASLGFDLTAMIDQKQLYVDHVHVERDQIEETGEYDLEGLFIRLNYAIESVGAKRVVLDTIETLFSGLSDVGILRAELNRLFRWLKDRKITAVITAERGDGPLTRHGLEEYISDCVIALDHRVDGQVSTRRLRIVKYRGSAHGTNEYPFLIDEQGFSVMPVTSLDLAHTSSGERISSGIADLDAMLQGQGFYRGSSILLSGTAGTGKTTFASHMAKAACDRGERTLYLAFEESPHQIMRNMRSVGLDLSPCVQSGLLHYRASRPTHYGIEMHLVLIYRLVEQIQPHVIIVDPISNLRASGTRDAASSALLRLVDFLKRRQITALFTNLTESAMPAEQTDVDISSLIDTWILLGDVESGGERNRTLYVLKSRGMAHSRQIREFVLSERGVTMTDPYIGPGGVLTGSARLAQEARDHAECVQHRQEIERLERELERRRQQMEVQTALLQSNWRTEQDELRQRLEQAQARYTQVSTDQSRMAASRSSDLHHSEQPPVRNESNPEAERH